MSLEKESVSIEPEASRNISSTDTEGPETTQEAEIDQEPKELKWIKNLGGISVGASRLDTETPLRTSKLHSSKKAEKVERKRREELNKSNVYGDSGGKRKSVLKTIRSRREAKKEAKAAHQRGLISNDHLRTVKRNAHLINEYEPRYSREAIEDRYNRRMKRVHVPSPERTDQHLPSESSVPETTTPTREEMIQRQHEKSAAALVKGILKRIEDGATFSDARTEVLAHYFQVRPEEISDGSVDTRLIDSIINLYFQESAQ